MEKNIAVWEEEGGALAEGPSPDLVGTASQIEWAERIRKQVDDEFDRVASALELVSRAQPTRERADTQAVIAILEEKRAEVMANPRAGYFIHDWQELGGQVRQMVLQDARFKAIKSRRLAAKTAADRRTRPMYD